MIYLAVLSGSPKRTPDSLNTVDLSLYLSGRSTPAHDRATAPAFVENAETVGVFYVRGWERVVPKALVESVFEYNKRFFDLPQGAQGFARVYEQQGESRVPCVRTRHRETFEIGNDCDPQYPEHWPKEEDLPGFKETINRFHLLCDVLHLPVMSLLALALNLPKDYFVPSISSRSACLRLLHYPPTRRDRSNSRLGAHKDSETITLLWHDETGGLEVEGPDGGRVAVEPKANIFVINMRVHSLHGGLLLLLSSSWSGDILSRWSNLKLKSTVHRAVLLPPATDDPLSGLTRTRRSVAYFCNPDPTAWIDCIPGLEGLDGPKYEPTLTGEYYAKALEAEIGV
ncbi:hypothetical protein JCM21900_002423 [Sporobolomyces salmonicolor]